MSKVLRMQGRQLVQRNSALDRRRISTANTLTDAPRDNFITKVKSGLKCIGVSTKVKGISGFIEGKLKDMQPPIANAIPIISQKDE